MAATGGDTDAFMCAICWQRCEEPTATSCGHAFCLHCLQQWIATGNATCPLDRSPLPPAASLRVNLAMRAAIERIASLELAGSAARRAAQVATARAATAASHVESLAAVQAALRADGLRASLERAPCAWALLRDGAAAGAILAGGSVTAALAGADVFSWDGDFDVWAPFEAGDALLAILAAAPAATCTRVGTYAVAVGTDDDCNGELTPADFLSSPYFGAPERDTARRGRLSRWVHSIHTYRIACTGAPSSAAESPPPTILLQVLVLLPGRGPWDAIAAFDLTCCQVACHVPVASAGHGGGGGRAGLALRGQGLSDALARRATWGATALAELHALPLSCAGEFGRTLMRGVKYAARGVIVDFPAWQAAWVQWRAEGAEAPGSRPKAWATVEAQSVIVTAALSTLLPSGAPNAATSSLAVALLLACAHASDQAASLVERAAAAVPPLPPAVLCAALALACGNKATAGVAAALLRVPGATPVAAPALSHRSALSGALSAGLVGLAWELVSVGAPLDCTAATRQRERRAHFGWEADEAATELDECRSEQRPLCIPTDVPAIVAAAALPNGSALVRLMLTLGVAADASRPYAAMALYAAAAAGEVATVEELLSSTADDAPARAAMLAGVPPRAGGRAGAEALLVAAAGPRREFVRGAAQGDADRPRDAILRVLIGVGVRCGEPDAPSAGCRRHEGDAEAMQPTALLAAVLAGAPPPVVVALLCTVTAGAARRAAYATIEDALTGRTVVEVLLAAWAAGPRVIDSPASSAAHEEPPAAAPVDGTSPQALPPWVAEMVALGAPAPRLSRWAPPPRVVRRSPGSAPEPGASAIGAGGELPPRRLTRRSLALGLAGWPAVDAARRPAPVGAAGASDVPLPCTAANAARDAPSPLSAGVSVHAAFARVRHSPVPGGDPPVGLPWVVDEGAGAAALPPHPHPLLPAVFAVHRQVQPHLHLSRGASALVAECATLIVESITCEAADFACRSGRATMSSRDVQSSARLLLRGELAKHAVSEGTKAVTKFTSA